MKNKIDSVYLYQFIMKVQSLPTSDIIVCFHFKRCEVSKCDHPEELLYIVISN